MKTKIIILLVIASLTSCRTEYKINYVIETAKGNFYTNDFVIKNDSIFIVEFNPNGRIRRGGVFKENEVTIKTVER